MPNPFNQGDYEFMPPPPKNKAGPPPPKKSGTRQLQVNRSFDTMEEMNIFLKMNFEGKQFKVVKTWSKTQIHCIVEIKD